MKQISCYKLNQGTKRDISNDFQLHKTNIRSKSVELFR